jgi:hypothetical protein
MRNFSRRGRTEQVDYDAEAYDAIWKLLDRQLAAVRPEIEARLAEPNDPGSPNGINPHHLTNGLHRLRAEHRIEETARITRGGRMIPVYVPCDKTGRSVAIDEAAARKRLLQTRYLGWAEGSSRAPNLIGAGGELVTRASLLSANHTTPNYRVLNPGGREVDTLFGARVEGGGLDLVAQLILEGGELETVITVTMEVKNLRAWIYPNAPELFQLLDKAGRLQVAHPRRRFMPVLICRRAQYLTFCMAKHLGFFVLIFDRRYASQPIQPHWTINPEQLKEVRDELGYIFTLTDEAMPHLTRQFERTVPNEAPATAEQWARMAPGLVSYFTALRDERLQGGERDQALDELYLAAQAIAPPTTTPWRTVRGRGVLVPVPF